MIRNIFALLRGNIVCFFKMLFAKNSKFSMFIRVFSRVNFQVNKKGSFTFGRGVAIGSGTTVTVRNGAKLVLGKMVSFNADCKVACHEKIGIGDYTIFGPNVLIYDHDHIFDAQSGVRKKEYVTSPVKIGKHCWIGGGAIILRGTVIGDNCVIGAGTVVKGEYPDGSLIVNERKTKVIELR